MFACFSGIGVGHLALLLGGRTPALVIEPQDDVDDPTDECDEEEQERVGGTADLTHDETRQPDGEVEYMDVEEDNSEVEDDSEEDEEDSGASDCGVSDNEEEVEY